MKTKNYYLSEKKFITISKWKDFGGCFILPTIIIDKHVPVSPVSTITRISFFFLSQRLSFDLGTIIYNENEKYNWKKSDMDEFLVWWRKEIKIPITKEKIEDFINKNEDVKNTIAHNSAKYYYTKRYLFKKLIRYLKEENMSNEKSTDFLL